MAIGLASISNAQTATKTNTKPTNSMKSVNQSLRFWLLALSLTSTVHATEYSWDTSADPGLQIGGGNWATTGTNWTADGGVTRVGWPNTGTDSARIDGTLPNFITISLNSPDIQLDDITTTPTGHFIYLQQLSNVSLVRTLTLTGGTYDGTGTTGSQFSVVSGLSLGGTAGTTAFKITGTSDIVKLGSGGLFITSANHDFTGNIYINQGNFYCNSGNDNSLGNAANDIFINGGTLNLQTNPLTLGSGRTITLGASGGSIGGAVDLTIQGQITGPGALTKVNAGAVNLEAACDYAGTTTIGNATLRLQANGTIPSASNLTISGIGNFNIRNTVNWTHTGTITGTGTSAINLNTGTNATLAGNISGLGILNASSAGTNTTVSGNISGATAVALQGNGAILTLSGDNSAMTGTVTLTGNTAGTQLNIKSATALGTGTFSIGGGNDGKIDNTSGDPLTLAGNNPQTWNSDFTFVGTDDLDLGTGAVTLGGNRAISVSANILTVGGDITGAFGIIKAEGGTLALTGTSSYTGSTSVQNGTLKLGASGSIAASAAVSISAGAILDASAQASYAIPGTQPLTFGINATGSGSSGRINAAILNVSSAAVTYSITGTLDDAVYVLATYSSLSGTPTFASVDPTPAGYTLQYAYESNKIALVKNAGSAYDTWATGDEPFDGDANGDGVKDGLAFLLGAATPGTNATDLLPTVTQSGGNLILNFNCLPVAARGTATLKVEHSNNLGSWTTTVDVVPDANDPIPDNNVTFVVGVGPVGPPALKAVQATINSAAAASGGKLFGRLKAVSE